MSQHGIGRLIEVMRRLRDPRGGCPWDLEQSFATIAPYTIEEAYEVADAIERGDMDDLKERAGRPAAAGGLPRPHGRASRAFAFDRSPSHHRQDDPPPSACVRRSPGRRAPTPRPAPGRPQGRRARIKGGGQSRRQHPSGRTRGLPALTRATSCRARRARGLRWPEKGPVLAKLRRRAERVGSGDRDPRCGGPARAEPAISCSPPSTWPATWASIRNWHCVKANGKFERRFRHIETSAAGAGEKPQDLTLAQLDALWDEAKAAEQSARPVKS